MIKFLKNIALLEFIPTKEILGAVADFIGLNKDQNVLNDMGLMLLIGLFIALSLLALVLLRYLALKTTYAWYRRYRKVRQLICYNGILRYILQSNLKMGVAACISLTLMNSTGSAVTSGLILFGIVLSPIVFRVIIVKNFK
jgi:hypothetical protein